MPTAHPKTPAGPRPARGTSTPAALTGSSPRPGRAPSRETRSPARAVPALRAPRRSHHAASTTAAPANALHPRTLPHPAPGTTAPPGPRRETLSPGPGASRATGVRGTGSPAAAENPKRTTPQKTAPQEKAAQIHRTSTPAAPAGSPHPPRRKGRPGTWPPVRGVPRTGGRSTAARMRVVQGVRSRHPGPGARGPGNGGSRIGRPVRGVAGGEGSSRTCSCLLRGCLRGRGSGRGSPEAENPRGRSRRVRGCDGHAGRISRSRSCADFKIIGKVGACRRGRRTGIRGPSRPRRAAR